MKYVMALFILLVSILAQASYSPPLLAPKFAGESYFAGVASATCTRTSTTIGTMSCNAAVPGPTVVYSSMGSWQTTDANLFKQTINSLPFGVYKAKFIFGASVSTAAETGFAITDGTTTCEAVQSESGSVRGNVNVECVFIYTTTANRSFELYAGSTAGTVTVFSNQTAPRISVKFNLEYWGPQ